jgi:diacylglycerol kinase (ATP)
LIALPKPVTLHPSTREWKGCTVGKGLVIVNPVAGQGVAGTRVPELERLLAESRLDLRVVLTERPMHAVELAERAARDGAEVVVAAGGDGTTNEVINGLMRARGSVARLPALAVFCIGRGNDFAYGAGIPSDLAEGVRALAEGHRRPMDVGLLVGGDYPQGRYFGNGVGIGFETVVGLEAAKMKRVHGFFAYVLGALRTLFLYYNAPLLRIEHSGSARDQRSIEMSVMNGRRMGGTFFMAPQALNDDGLFDLCIADAPRRLTMIGLLLKYMKGTQGESPHISLERASALEVTALEGGLVIHADGETICTAGTKVRFECLPRQLEIVARRPDA